MTAQKLITVGENENTVFRSCKDGIHTNVFETICAFLNTRGRTGNPGYHPGTEDGNSECRHLPAAV